MRGCDRTVRLGNPGGGMAGKYDRGQWERGVVALREAKGPMLLSAHPTWPRLCGNLIFPRLTAR